MARFDDGASLDCRARIIALAEALDQLIVVSRRHTDADQVWLKQLIELGGDVHDLLEANAYLDSIDLHDVCEQIHSLVVDMGAHAAFDDDPSRIDRPPDPRDAQADWVRIVCDMCDAGKRFTVKVGSNSTGAH